MPQLRGNEPTLGLNRVLLNSFLDMNHNIIILLTKNHPELVCCFAEKLKTSPTRKFAANPEIVLNSNSMINPEPKIYIFVKP